jgi:Tripartite tricarboxylate transporter family receptor
VAIRGAAADGSPRIPHYGAACGATTERRSPGLPEVPTFQKAGIKGLVIEPWFGVFVPADTPAAIVARLNYPLSYANFNGMQIRVCRRVPSQLGWPSRGRRRRRRHQGASMI